MTVFLSYASEQREVAEQINLALLGAGYDVFFDRDDLPAGDDYHTRIRNAVQASEAFIFLISPQSVARGKYTLTELKYARERWPDPRKKVLPVMVEATDYGAIPAYLKAVSVLEPEGSAPAEVVAAVKAWGVKAETEPRPVNTSGKGLLGILLLLVGTLGLGEGPGAFFPEYLSPANALVMMVLSAAAFVLGVWAWVDIDRGRAKGKPLALLVVALSVLEFLGLGVAFLAALVA